MLPILYQSHDFVLYAYPFLMGIGWGLGLQLYFSLLAEKKISRTSILLIGLFASSWIGAKLLFYLTVGEKFGTYIDQISFWTGGGFVYYGGLIGGLLYLLLFHLLIRKITLIEINAFVPSLALGHGIGRVGCLLAGCCFGKETSAWWGMHLHGVSRIPTQAIEALILFLLCYFFWKQRKNQKELFSQYLLIYGVSRIGLEVMRDDEIRGLWGLLTPSQWISVFLILLALTIRKFSNSQKFQP
jgi:phosphatidylglycerol:prolipoprotein diacylglycerol transferase